MTQAGFKHVLNLQWIMTGELVVDTDQLELTFIYDDQEKKSAGKIRMETAQELTSLEKVLRESVESSRILKLPTRPSHKTMSVYIKSDVSDEVLLIKLIESVTRLDEFLWLRNNAHSLLKRSGYTVDNQGLIDRCLRPCFLLSRRADVPEYADSRFCDSITFLETDLLTWVESLEVQKLMPLAEAVRKLAQYYSRARTEFRQLGYSVASIPPNTVTLASHVASPRIIEGAALQALLTGPKEGHGLAHVTKKHGIYWKQNPSHPGVEFATDSFSALVATRATCAACLVKFSYFDDKQKPKSQLVLASKAVFGKTLRETLQTSPGDLNSIDMESFSEIFIISLLTCPQDWKSDNLIVSKMDGKTSIVGIDNDHSFADPVVSVGNENNVKHTINVKNILFCLPQCNLAIHPNTRRKILELEPLQLLCKWVQALSKQNALYQSLLDEKFLSILDLKQLNLPIRLRDGTLLQAYRVLTNIQKVLLASEDVTLNYLFQTLYPVLYEYYNYFNCKRSPETNLETHFNQTIWAMPPFENFPDLMDTLIRHKGQDMFLKDALPEYQNKTFDMFKGDRMPVEELESLLREASWTNIDPQAQLDMIAILKKLNFINLTVTGSSELTGGDVAAITDASPGLLQIQLVRCSKITQDALKLQKNRGIATYVSGCSVTSDEVLELAKQGYHISLIDSAELDGDHPTGEGRAGSMAVEAPAFFHAIESIRYARFDEAYGFLSQPGAIPVHILAKYKDRLLQNISLPDLMRCKHSKLLELLVRSFGWNINEATVTGRRPWHYVTQTGDVNWAKNIVAICPTLSINCQNAELETCLHLAVAEGDLPMLTYLMEELKCDPMICDSKMRTPLTCVLRQGNLSVETKTAMAKILIDCSKDLNGWRDNAQNTFLHIALRNRLLTVAARLISSGINVNAENMNGETPLHVASVHRCRDISANGVFRNLINVLVDAGANLLAKTKTGRTSMHYAVRGGSRTIIATLAALNQSLLTIPDSNMMTPLHAAVEVVGSATTNSLRELMEPRYKQIVDWNAKSSLGVTPFILAAQKTNWLAIELLSSLEEVQVDLQDSAMNTALFYAVTRTCLPAVQVLLQKRGSNPNKGNGTTSPMWRAVMVLYKDLLQASGTLDSAQRLSFMPAAPQSSSSASQPSSSNAQQLQSQPSWMPTPVTPYSGDANGTQTSPRANVSLSPGPASSPADVLSNRQPSSSSPQLLPSPLSSSASGPGSVRLLSPPTSVSWRAGATNSITLRSPLASPSAISAPGSASFASTQASSSSATTSASPTLAPVPENGTSIASPSPSPPPLLSGNTPAPAWLYNFAIPIASYSGGPIVPASHLRGIRHDIAASLFHYGGDMESPNLHGSYLIHEIATRALKDGMGSTGPAELEFLYANAPHAVHRMNKSNESFLHILAKCVPVGSPAPLLDTLQRLWKRYRFINSPLAPAFYEKETAEGLSLIHLLVQSSNDLLLQDLATGSNPVLSKLKFSFDGSKTIRKHPVLCALAIGNLPICSLLFEHFSFNFSKSEWKQVLILAMKVGCLEMAKNAQTRCKN